MGRTCTDLLEPHRALGEAPNLLLAEALLAFPEEGSDEAFHAACGLLDLSGTAQAAAVLAIQAAALMEGRTTQVRLAPEGALDQAHGLAAGAGAASFDCVAVLARSIAAPAALKSADRLPGVWVAVSDDPAVCRDSVFDLVVTTQEPTLDGARVFRMLASMLAKETLTCLDSHDFLAPLQIGPSCRLLDAFLLPGNDEVQLASAEQEDMLRHASGILVVHHVVPGLDTLDSATRLFRSLRRRAPPDVPAALHLPVRQRVDAVAGSPRPIDVLVASAR